MNNERRIKTFVFRPSSFVLRPLSIFSSMEEKNTKKVKIFEYERIKIVYLQKILKSKLKVKNNQTISSYNEKIG